MGFFFFLTGSPEEILAASFAATRCNSSRSSGVVRSGIGFGANGSSNGSPVMNGCFNACAGVQRTAGSISIMPVSKS